MEASRPYESHRGGDFEPRGRTSREPASRSKSPRRQGREGRRYRSPRRHHEDRSERRAWDRENDDGHRRRRQKHRQPRIDEGQQARTSLPFDARSLTKSDYMVFRPLFAYYLDLQKGKYMEEMDEREARGRWKSFLRKWNAGELSEGWYDPEMFATAKERMGDVAPLSEVEASRGTEGKQGQEEPEERHRDRDGSGSGDNDDDDDMGPMLPPTSRSAAQRSGPGIPNLDDLTALRETRTEEARESRQAEYAELRHARLQDRKLQKERLDDLVPRAEAGTRERRLEKKAVVNEKMRGFRDKSPGGDAAVGDRELMGGGDGLDELRREKAENERRKTEREIRREEVARAKAVEREERVREWKEREEGTMKALKELARQRFG